MPLKVNWNGVFPAVPTQFKDDFSLDLPATQKHIEMLLDMADVDNIVCVKEASGDVRRITDLLNALGDRYLIFSGLDDVALESTMLGCTGWVSGLVDAFPRENRLLWDAATSGDYQTALEIYRWYMPLLHFDSQPKLVQLIKRWFFVIEQSSP